MKDVLKATYELYESKLQGLFDETVETKKMLNRLAKDMGRTDMPYPDVTPESIGGGAKIKPDQFYNKPLATAVRELLEIRGEATAWEEIVRVLREGNFDLPKTRQAEDEARMTVLRNTGNFALVGGNYFGLKSWYPESKKSKGEKKSNSQQAIDAVKEGKV